MLIQRPRPRPSALLHQHVGKIKLGEVPTIQRGERVQAKGSWGDNMGGDADGWPI
jgi:hypothetical protein